MKVLFLDIDGVLNSEASARLDHWKSKQPGGKAHGIWQFCPLATNNFRILMDRIPDMKIVLSSCWRVGRTESECSVLLTENGLDGSRCIGRTGTSSAEENRGVEIQRWLDLHPGVTDFVILDDNSDMGPLLPKLVKTSYRVGLTLDHVDEIAKRFHEN